MLIGYHKYYTYGFPYTVHNLLAWIMSVVLLPFSIIAPIGYPLLTIMNGSYSFETLMEYFAIIFLAIGTFTWIVPEVNKYVPIIVEEEGLRIGVRFSLQRWKKIPWSNIIKVEQAKILDVNQKPLWFIQVESCTVWHRFLGRRYLSLWEPIFLIGGGISNSERLIETIQNKIAE